MEIIETLEKTGLNQKEARVYLALLELGTSSVEGIAKKAETKRPTTYLILDSLQKKGLVSIVPRAKKSLFTAESPEQIIRDLNRKQELVKKFLPNMLALYNTKKEKPKVLLFEGKEAVREVYEKILSAQKANFFGTIRDHIKTYPDFPPRLFEKTRRKEIRVQEILTQTDADLKFAITVPRGEYYQQRLALAGQDFLTDNVLFDNNVVFFSYEPYIFAVVIQSKTIYQSILTLFELAWQSAEPSEKVLK